MIVNNDTLLEQAQEELLDNIEEGTTCLCCGQLAKIYKMKMTSTMAFCLIKLSKKPDAFYHISTMGHSGGGEFAKLRHWGLIEQQENNNNKKKRTSGFWAITPKGREFVLSNIKIPKYYEIYNNNILEFSNELITIKQALNNKFDYSELMSN